MITTFIVLYVIGLPFSVWLTRAGRNAAIADPKETVSDFETGAMFLVLWVLSPAFLAIFLGACLIYVSGRIVAPAPKKVQE